MRACPETGKTECMVSDHGGNYWKIGSLNTDWNWKLGLTSLDRIKEIEAEHQKPENERESEPISCPNCHELRRSGPKCHACGHESTRRSRFVKELDGTLHERFGDCWKPKEVRAPEPADVTLWKKAFFRARNCNHNFKQARLLFFRENGYWPSGDLPLMPIHESDWGLKVKDVPFNRLRQQERK